MLSTMCGHCMVSHSVAKKMVDWVKEGRRTPEDAVTYLARFCSWGVFNPSRAKRGAGGCAGAAIMRPRVRWRLGSYGISASRSGRSGYGPSEGLKSLNPCSAATLQRILSEATKSEAAPRRCRLRIDNHAIGIVQHVRRHNRIRSVRQNALQLPFRRHLQQIVHLFDRRLLRGETHQIHHNVMS